MKLYGVGFTSCIRSRPQATTTVLPPGHMQIFSHLIDVCAMLILIFCTKGKLYADVPQCMFLCTKLSTTSFKVLQAQLYYLDSSAASKLRLYARDCICLRPDGTSLCHIPM